MKFIQQCLLLIFGTKFHRNPFNFKDEKVQEFISVKLDDSE